MAIVDPSLHVGTWAPVENPPLFTGLEIGLSQRTRDAFPTAHFPGRRTETDDDPSAPCRCTTSKLRYTTHTYTLYNSFLFISLLAHVCLR